MTAAAKTQAEGTDMRKVLEEYDREQAVKGMFRPQGPGEFYGRILPPRVHGLYYVAFGMHFNIAKLSPRLGDVRGVACYRETLGQECILCKTQQNLYYEGRNENDAAKLNLAKDIRVKSRRVVNFVDINNPAAGVMTWEYPATAGGGGSQHVSVASKIGALFKEWGDITDPETGKVLKLTWEKKGDFLTCEDVAITARSVPIPVQNWREARHDLEAYARSRIMPADQLVQLLKDDGPAPVSVVTDSNPEMVGGEVTIEDVKPSEEDPTVQEILAQLNRARKAKAS